MSRRNPLQGLPPAQRRTLIYLASLDGEWIYSDDLARALNTTTRSVAVFVAGVRAAFGKGVIETSKGFQGLAKYRLNPKVMADAR